MNEQYHTTDQKYYVVIDYTNYKGIRSTRTIIPEVMFFAATEHHPDPQWLVSGFDVDKQGWRTFAMKDIHSWKPKHE